MKQICIAYSWHETSKSSDAERHTSSFTVEVEDEAFADCVEQETPYGFAWTKTRRQAHVAELAYWHAAMHGRFILSSDQILSIRRGGSMTVKEFITRNRQQYINLSSRCRRMARSTSEIIRQADYLARASVYNIIADDMLEILECAEDIVCSMDMPG